MFCWATVRQHQKLHTIVLSTLTVLATLEAFVIDFSASLDFPHSRTLDCTEPSPYKLPRSPLYRHPERPRIFHDTPARCKTFHNARCTNSLADFVKVGQASALLHDASNTAFSPIGLINHQHGYPSIAWATTFGHQLDRQPEWMR